MKLNFSAAINILAGAVMLYSDNNIGLVFICLGIGILATGKTGKSE